MRRTNEVKLPAMKFWTQKDHGTQPGTLRRETPRKHAPARNARLERPRRHHENNPYSPLESDLGNGFLRLTWSECRSGSGRRIGTRIERAMAGTASHSRKRLRQRLGK